jgi:HSP20 family protein
MDLAFDRRGGLGMKDQEDAYVVSMRLPEFRKDEVQVELRDGYVTIRASRRGRGLRSAGRQETIARSFRLPADADRERLEATFDEGTLTLRIHRLDSRARSVSLR